MIDFNKKRVKDNVIEYTFVQNGVKHFSFRDFIGISKNHDGSHTFVEAMDRALKDSQSVFKAYYWECPPIRQDTVDDQFTFVTVKAPGLSGVEQNFLDFQDKFFGNKHKSVCSFENLSGDATLVIPIPKSDRDFAHLAKFNENADSNTKRALWEKVAEELKTALKDNQPRWLSTSGMGVNYLHVRIDKVPKYYQYENYRIPPGDRSASFEASRSSRSYSSNSADFNKDDYMKTDFNKDDSGCGKGKL